MSNLNASHPAPLIEDATGRFGGITRAAVQIVLPEVDAENSTAVHSVIGAVVDRDVDYLPAVSYCCIKLDLSSRNAHFARTGLLQTPYNHRLGILRDHCAMRKIVLLVGVLALASSLDSSLYGGFYTRGIVQMFSDMAAGFGLH